MKKRAQRPDAYTFTLLLRGFSSHPDKKNLETALRVYNSMVGENSQVKPSVIHTNTILMVCATNGALDEMFSIAAKLPDRGLGSADKLTYTTILNAIRVEAWKTNPDETEESRLQRRQRGVFQGRRIWQDVAYKWIRNELTIDEELVCAMGRLLLVGNQKTDTDDVLSLLEQTMRLPRQMHPLGHSQRGTHLKSPAEGNFKDPFNPSMNESHTSENSPEGESHQLSGPQSQSDTPEQSLQPGSAEFKLRPSESGPIVYPIPGRNTLSMVVDACTRMRAFKPAQKYWETITASVDPDLENYHMYLRLLRASRSSSLAVELVQDLCKSVKAGGLGAKVQRKTFRIAMSACVRDGNNPTAIRHGTRLLTLMQMHLEEADVETVKWFTGLLAKQRFRPPQKSSAAQKPHHRVNDAVAALDALFCTFVNLRGLFAYGRTNLKQNIIPESEYEAMLNNLEPADLSWVKSRPPNNKNEAERWQMMEQRSLISSEERFLLQTLGRIIEREFTRGMTIYNGRLTAFQWQKLFEDRARIRSWYLKRPRLEPIESDHSDVTIGHGE